jgi:hypothetical protein
VTVTVGEFREAVRTAAQGTPYVVKAVDGGFDLQLDVANAAWFGLFDRAGLSRMHVHHVRLRDDGRYVVVDDVRGIDWVAGTPRTAVTAERVRGRVKTFGREKVWALDEHGRFGVRADFRFDSEEGRELVTGVGDQLGLRLRRSTEETIGLAFALGTIAVALLMGLVVLVLWLAGVIPPDR